VIRHPLRWLRDDAPVALLVALSFGAATMIVWGLVGIAVSVTR
jgi:hypothetical protein